MQVRLRENEASREHFKLTFEQLRSLQSAQYSLDRKPAGSLILSVVPSAVRGEYHLRANDVVGAFTVGDIEVVIEPKCGNARLDFLLSLASLRKTKSSDTIYVTEGSIRDHLALHFLNRLALATGEGAFETYQRRVELGVVPKGQIDFTKMGNGLPSPITYKYDAFTSDNPLNSVLAAVLEGIIHSFGAYHPIGQNARQHLDSLDVAPSGAPLDNLPLAEELCPDGHYQDCLKIGEMILRGSGVLTNFGALPSSGLLFQMSRVFEDFVTSVVASEATSAGIPYDVQGRRRRKFLDLERQMHLRPDICIGRNGPDTVVTVIDAKYKYLNEAPSRSDIYQMMAYCEAYETNRGVLIGLGRGPERIISTMKPRLQIRCIKLDLANDSESTILRKLKTSLTDSF